jgi:hypothetical protein
MMDGHVHQVLIEQRNGMNCLTIVFGTGLRDGCQIHGNSSVPKTALTRYPTSIVATVAFAHALNQGDIMWVRSDPSASATRQTLLAYLQGHSGEDEHWALMADDLRRYASLPLCHP